MSQKEKAKELTLGVVFLRFPKKFQKNITKSRILKMLRAVETADIKFLDALSPSTVIFAKRRGLPRETIIDLVKLAFGKRSHDMSIVAISLPMIMQLCDRLNEMYSLISNNDKLKEQS
ncbi:MAG: hypothetical protein ACP6IS_03410 [Candidatus Asgardarchaeia archaeon]